MKTYTFEHSEFEMDEDAMQASEIQGAVIGKLISELYCNELFDKVGPCELLGASLVVIAFSHDVDTALASLEKVALTWLADQGRFDALRHLLEMMRQEAGEVVH